MLPVSVCKPENAGWTYHSYEIQWSMTDDMWMGKQSYVSIKIQLKAWKSQQKSLYKTAIKLDACERTVKDIRGEKIF